MSREFLREIKCHLLGWKIRGSSNVVTVRGLGLTCNCSLPKQCDRLLSDRGSPDGEWKRSSRKNSQREGMSELELEGKHLNPNLWSFVLRHTNATDPKGSLPSCLITFLNFFLFQLVDFEAMTAPGSEAFSKIAKSWMNLKR